MPDHADRISVSHPGAPSRKVTQERLPVGPAHNISLIQSTMRPALMKFSLLLSGASCAAVLLDWQRDREQSTAEHSVSADGVAHVTLDDLQSDAAALLYEADGVQRVERLVIVRAPRHRIIHVADWHTVPHDFYAADLRAVSDHPVTDDEIEKHYAFSDAVTKVVQLSQRKLLRWMGTYYGVRTVFLEGVTDQSLPAYLTLVRSVGRRGPDFLPPDFGAAAQAFLAGHIEELRAAEDESASERAKIEAVGHLVFDGPANEAREAAIVHRLIESASLAVVVLGGDHDLSKHVREVPGCEYLRVFVDGYPIDR